MVQKVIKIITMEINGINLNMVLQIQLTQTGQLLVLLLKTLH